MKKALISGLCILSVNSFAGTTNSYDVKQGYAKTSVVSETEQLGVFSLIIKSDQKEKRKKSKTIRINGVIRGILDPSTFTLTHTFVNHSRTGTLITAGDSITNIYSGDPSCANGSVPFSIEETLFIVAGTGIYADVEAGSYVTVDGVVNNCPDSPNYLQNNFTVTGGSITFN